MLCLIRWKIPVQDDRPVPGCELNENLAEVKKETAGVMAEETRTRRLMEENQAEAARYEDLAKQALLAGNEGDAKVFLAKKQQLESAGAGLVTAYTAAHENAVKMRQMHDKLVSDIEALKARRRNHQSNGFRGQDAGAHE